MPVSAVKTCLPLAVVTCGHDGAVFGRPFVNSQVHYVNKYTFVQIFWRLANLYIFGITRAWGIQKLMLAFAPTPLRPPFWIFKMAAIKYVFCDISASNQLRNLNKYANPMFSGPRNPMVA